MERPSWENVKQRSQICNGFYFKLNGTFQVNSSNFAGWELGNKNECAPKADTLKQLRPIGKGDQELEKRLDQKELT
jgi:hypothetical protein